MTDPLSEANRTDPRLGRAVAIAQDLRARLDTQLEKAREPIAIVGIGCRLPGGVRSADDFWQLLIDGRDGVDVMPEQRWSEPAADATSAPLTGGFLDDVESFDARFFGVAPREARQLDPQQRLFLEVGWDALEDAGCTKDGLRASLTGVFVGANSTDHLQLTLADPRVINMYTVVGNANCIIANRLSYAFDLQGPSMVVDTACSSSLVALHLAAQSLRLHECDRAVVGGVNLILSPAAAQSHLQGLPVAPGGRCRTFDAAADGYTRGEGVVAVVARRLSDAVRDGDRIWAVVHGSAVNQDGMTSGIAAPNGLAQLRVMHSALQAARVRPGQVTLIEAHGTGTSLGDPIEVEALVKVYGSPEDHAGQCALGSVKTNLGHLEAGAGITGVVKAALAIAHRVVPANLHFQTLNPNIELAGSRFFVPTTATSWEEDREHRFAAVSAFGAGGTNAHAILGPGPEPALASTSSRERPCVLAISAPSEGGLRRMAEAYRDFLRSPSGRGSAFSDLCFTAHERRTQHEHRLCVVADSADQAANRISGWLSAEPTIGVQVGRCSPPITGRTAFIFPGQGAQRPDMGHALMKHSPAYREAVSEVDEHLQHWLGSSVLAELDRIGGPQSHINLVQPALFAVSVGLTAVLREQGVTPDAVIGHSMGEVAAAHAAGILSLADATRVIGLRSRLLRRISGQGAMLVVGLGHAEAAAVVRQHSELVSVAVVNSPRSTVLSGDAATLGLIADTLRDRNVFVKPVQVDVASHSPQVDPLTDELLECLAGITPVTGEVAMMSAVTGTWIAGTELDPGYWVRNLREPVLFAAGIESLIDAGHDIFLELSPHPILTSAVEQALEAAGRRGVAAAAMHRDADDAASGLEVLAALHCVGRSPRWDSLWGSAPSVVTLPGYPYEQSAFPLPLPQQRAALTPHLGAAAIVESEPESPPVGIPLTAELITDCVLHAVAAELGSPVDLIDLDAGFFQIGMDSRLATAVRLRIEAVIGRRIAATVMFEQPTVRLLAQFVSALLTPQQDVAVEAPEPAATPAPAHTAGEPLDELSAHDLEELLAEEIRLSMSPSEGSTTA